MSEQHAVQLRNGTSVTSQTTSRSGQGTNTPSLMGKPGFLDNVGYCVALPSAFSALLEHQGLVPGSLFLIGNAKASKSGTVAQHALSPVSQELGNLARDGCHLLVLHEVFLKE